MSQKHDAVKVKPLSNEALEDILESLSGFEFVCPDSRVDEENVDPIEFLLTSIDATASAQILEFSTDEYRAKLWAINAYEPIFPMSDITLDIYPYDKDTEHTQLSNECINRIAKRIAVIDDEDQNLAVESDYRVGAVLAKKARIDAHYRIVVSSEEDGK